MIDVIVVGAGPAGSTAAAALSKAGRRVLLVDRSAFPRDKTCGDAIQGGAISLLRALGCTEPLDAEWFTPIRSWSIEFPSRRVISAELQSNGHDPYISRRVHFDHLVYQQALANGAEFCQAQVTGPICENGRVVGVTAKSPDLKETVEWRAPLVIAADGATSAIGRALTGNRQEEIHWAVAIRGYVQMKRDLHNHCEFYFPQSILPGYGWIFPIGEREANIGIGMRLDKYRQQAKPLRALFDDFLAMVGDRLDRSTLGEIKSWQLPFGSKQTTRAYDGCLLAGDAGSFVDPLLGAGIYFAMMTGYLAAQVADAALRDRDTSARRLAEFDSLWKTALGKQLFRATVVQRFIVSYPWALNLVAEVANLHPLFGRPVIKFLSGEKI